ncbi:hypothetical protein TIFTF001_024365 [Ficus carica]|uniref:Uncharacterized protein n=1 Tax=Ficus carica TaxID=3494 RepID=A0AA88DG03_FICCA|nr:hypothetical protein TIFTF001_024365 [Ficus carica]
MSRRDLARTREEVAKARDEREKMFKRERTRPKLPDNPARDMTKYCEFHKDHGHNTVDCRAVRAEVAELLKKGHLREFLTEKVRETYGLGNESKERKIVQQIEDTPSPLPVQKTIGVICGV